MASVPPAHSSSSGGAVQVTDMSDDARVIPTAAVDAAMDLSCGENLEENFQDVAAKVATKPSKVSYRQHCGPYDALPGYKLKLILLRRYGPFDRYDFLKPLKDNIGTAGIKAMFSLGTEGNNCEWFFVTHSMDDFNTMLNAKFVVNGCTAIIQDPCNMLVTAKVHWLPTQYPDWGICDTLEEYGVEVIDIYHEFSRIAELDTSRTGTRVVTFRAKEADLQYVPHVLNFLDYRDGSGTRTPRGLITFPGRKPLCLKCRCTGHMAKQCPNNKCRHCQSFGHKAEDCVRYFSQASYADIIRDRPDMIRPEPSSLRSNRQPPMPNVQYQAQPKTLASGQNKVIAGPSAGPSFRPSSGPPSRPSSRPSAGPSGGSSPRSASKANPVPAQRESKGKGRGKSSAKAPTPVSVGVPVAPPAVDHTTAPPLPLVTLPVAAPVDMRVPVGDGGNAPNLVTVIPDTPIASAVPVPLVATGVLVEPVTCIPATPVEPGDWTTVASRKHKRKLSGHGLADKRVAGFPPAPDAGEEEFMDAHEPGVSVSPVPAPIAKKPPASPTPSNAGHRPPIHQPSGRSPPKVLDVGSSFELSDGESLMEET